MSSWFGRQSYAHIRGHCVIRTYLALYRMHTDTINQQKKIITNELVFVQYHRSCVKILQSRFSFRSYLFTWLSCLSVLAAATKKNQFSVL